MWLRCETQTKIEEITGVPQQTVTRIIAEFTQNAHLSEMGKFRDFEQENSALRIYDLWLRCETQSKIEEITGISQQRVSEIIANFTGSAQVSKSGKFRENSKDGNSAIFRDFEQDGSALRIYDLWLRCETHEKIAEITGYDRTTITKIIQSQKRKEGK